MLLCVLLPPDERSADPASGQSSASGDGRGAPGGELTRRLLTVAPRVERQGPVAFLDVRGTARLHGGVAGLFAALREALAPARALGMALASNRFTAEMAARHGRGAITVAPGDEALFLSRLPLEVLPLTPELARRLEPLGLETLGDFASLPTAAVERRYGARGLALLRLARGEDEAGLLPEPDQTPLTVSADLPGGADGLQRLAPALQEALAQLTGALVERGSAVVRLELALSLDAPPGRGTWEVVPAAPETRTGLLLELLSQRLAAAPPDRPATALELTVREAAPPAVHQNSLFGEVARDAARASEALSRLAGQLGGGALERPVVRAAHPTEERWHREPLPTAAGTSGGRGRGGRRGGGRQRRADEATPAGRDGAARDPAPVPVPLRWLPEPERLVPILVGGELAGFRRGRRELRLGRLSPPRRLEGGWWRRRPWARDEFELQTAEGELFRVCRDMASRRWLLLAEWD